MDDAMLDDDFDPLAPVMYGIEPAAGVDGVPTDDDDVSGADGGVADGENIVRVWVEDGRLTKIRVSPNWATKLGQRSLSGPFAQALGMAHVAVASEQPVKRPEFDDVDFSQLPQFSVQSLGAVQAMLTDTQQRREAAITRWNERPAPPPRVVTGRAKGVTVELNDAGHASKVYFDEKWLDTAQAGTICTHVMAAAQAAYERYVPRIEDRSELDALEEEQAFLMAAFKAILNPKEQR